MDRSHRVVPESGDLIVPQAHMAFLRREIIRLLLLETVLVLFDTVFPRAMYERKRNVVTETDCPKATAQF